MKGLLVGGLAAACAGLGAYLLLAKKADPAPAEPPAPAVVAPSAPKAPAVLAEVVDITDLDPLLDPPTRSAAGTPFDADPPAAPAPTPAPAFIPPIIEDTPETAPEPREVVVPVPFPIWGVSGIRFIF